MLIENEQIDCLELKGDAPNILSVSQLTNIGYTAIITKGKFLLLKPRIEYSGEVKKWLKKLSKDWKDYIIEIEEKNGLYKLKMEKQINKNQQKMVFIGNTTQKKAVNLMMVDTKLLKLEMKTAPASPILRLHCAFGHISLKNLKELKIPIKKEDQFQVKNCLTCIATKHKMKPTTGRKERNIDEVFQQIHVDTAGPFIRGKHKWYVVIVVDQYSKFMYSATTSNKHDIKDILNKWLQEQHTTYKRQPERITTDKGSEFYKLAYTTNIYGNKSMEVLIEPHLDLAPTGNKQWNGTAERAVQTLKTLQKLITAHLNPESEKRFIREFLVLNMTNQQADILKEKIMNHIKESNI